LQNGYYTYYYLVILTNFQRLAHTYVTVTESEWEEDKCTKRGKPEGNTPFGRSKRRREDTKIILK